MQPPQQERPEYNKDFNLIDNSSFPFGAWLAWNAGGLQVEKGGDKTHKLLKTTKEKKKTEATAQITLQITPTSP